MKLNSQKLLSIQLVGIYFSEQVSGPIILEPYFVNFPEGHAEEIVRFSDRW